MPIYEFKCEICDHEFEKLVFMGDEKYTSCPKCGGKDLRKMMSTANAIGAGLGSACGSGGFS